MVEKKMNLSSRMNLAKGEEEREKIKGECLNENRVRFREFYKEWFNKRICSYREEMFKINWFVYDGEEVCDIVNLKGEDNVFEVGVSWGVHHKERIYPSQSSMLKIIDRGDLVVAGFNFSDCVQRFVEEAVKQRRNVLIDRELTDLIPDRINLFSDYFHRKD